MTLIGTGALEARLHAIGQTQNFMRHLALSVVREQKYTVPRKTGNLARSIHIGSVTATSAQVIADANYATYTEFGTKPHTIVPRKAKVLRFAPSGTGRLTGSPRSGGPVVFAKKVNHPGTRAMHWAQRGTQIAISNQHLADVIIAEWNGAA